MYKKNKAIIDTFLKYKEYIWRNNIKLTSHTFKMLTTYKSCLENEEHEYREATKEEMLKDSKNTYPCVICAKKNITPARCNSCGNL